jgi:hydrogenase expression/formation protein HypC
MCLGVPMQVKSISEDMAVCEIDGVQREASLMMIDHVRVGDYVLIHAGFAIEKIDEDEAQLTLQALREALEMGLTPE